MIRTEKQIKNNPYLNKLKEWLRIDPSDNYGSRAIEILEECMRTTPIPEGTYKSSSRKKKEKLFSDSGKDYNDGNYYDEHHIIPVSAGGSMDDPENRVFIPHCEEYPFHNEVHVDYYLSTTLFPGNLHEFTIIPAKMMSNNFSLTLEQAGKLNEEFRQVKSESARKQWEDPKYKQVKSESTKKQWEDSEFRRIRSESARKQWEDPEFRKFKSESSRKHWEDPEFRQTISDSTKKHWDDQEYRHKISRTKRKKFLQKTGFILKFDKNNNLLEIFDKINDKAVYHVISGKQKTSGGYFYAAEKKNWPSFLESINDPIKKQELVDRFEELKRQYYENNPDMI